ncbi:DUF6480 family protein [Streptomyces sp. NPDC001380]|uniref:DUF6480 family protein n=1 Tax=Streptomyces sp. NPDC001380 TaxID=3364566 RepID=UPI0036C0315B
MTDLQHAAHRTPPALVPPAETPECESSTTAGISTPESPALHNAWSGRWPLVIIGLLVIVVIGFFAARIAAF